MISFFLRLKYVIESCEEHKNKKRSDLSVFYFLVTLLGGVAHKICYSTKLRVNLEFSHSPTESKYP